jgi:hypothetical protein
MCGHFLAEAIVQGKRYFFTYDRLLFGFAGIWNLTAASMLLIAPQSQLERLRIAEPNARWLVRSLASSAAAWGLGYLLIAIDTRRFRDFIWLGVISKTLFALISFWAALEGAPFIASTFPGLIDLILAGLFVERLTLTKE